MPDKTRFTSTSTLQQILHKVRERLERSGTLEPQLNAEYLVSHVTGITRSELPLYTETRLSEQQSARLTHLVEQRCKGVPLEYLLGYQDFYNVRLKVKLGVLIPRPETEILVDEALRIVKQSALPSSPRILDVGTGSGNIALALAVELPKSMVFAVDSCKAALELATQNLTDLHLGNRVFLVRGNLADAFGVDSEEDGFDLITANLPYIPSRHMATLQREVRDHEPWSALDGGEDGLDFYRLLAMQAHRLLKTHGSILLEFYPKQAKGLHVIFSDSHLWKETRIILDLARRPRIFCARKQ